MAGHKETMNGASGTPGSRGHCSCADPAPAGQRGIALLMVLWVLATLAVIVLSFSYITRTETHAALSYRQAVERKFLAEAGVERGTLEILYRNAHKNDAVVLEGQETWKTDGSRYTVQTETGHFVVGITEESGKVDINSAPEVILRNLLQHLGLKNEDIDTITDSILDWKDADDLLRLHGAENAYYLSLPRPYRARDANFETLEELLLVKGITPEILYGENGKKGLIDLITVHAKTGKINPNAASHEVLLSIPGMTTELAEVILAARQTGEIRDLQTIAGQNYALISPYIDLAGSGAFTIDSSGYTGTATTGYGIRAVVRISNNKTNYLFYRSPVDRDHERDNSTQ